MVTTYMRDPDVEDALYDDMEVIEDSEFQDNQLFKTKQYVKH